MAGITFEILSEELKTSIICHLPPFSNFPTTFHRFPPSNAFKMVPKCTTETTKTQCLVIMTSEDLNPRPVLYSSGSQHTKR